MCGIIGVFGHEKVINDILDGLLVIQHRGQDAAGAVTYDNKFHLKKGLGLVRDVFSGVLLEQFPGKIGLGHVRYPTVGVGNPDDAQPFTVNSPFGLSMVHNGNVVNYSQLKKELFEKNYRLLNSNCDVEVILNVFADELRKQNLENFSPDMVFEAVRGVFNRVKGSYSVLAIIAGKGFVAFRDPYGIKPIIFGKKIHPSGLSYMFCSESVGLNAVEYKIERDVMPGEAIFIDNDMKFYSKKLADKPHSPCIFEWIYFARPDSLIDQISVYKTRLRLGKALAIAWKKKYPHIVPDVVIPVPDTAQPAAMAFSEELGIIYREALIKNKYIGRTFIMPSQNMRQNSVKRKLNPIPLEIKDKKVLIVDDSIVRGTTSKKIVQMVRNAGAKEVYFLSTSPPLKYPCVYGIDMSTKAEFIARHYNDEQIKDMIEADKLLYQQKEDMIEAARHGNKDICNFCTACFDGEYPTEDITEDMLMEIEHERLDAKDESLKKFL